jgi:hypothetical protein
MAAGEPIAAVQSVAKMPNDPVPELQTVIFENLVQNDIERENLTFTDVIPHLPAE